MADRLSLWRQKLLDMGKRNKLLNFKETQRTSLQILHPELDDLYSAVIRGAGLEFPMIDLEKQETVEDCVRSTVLNGMIESSKVGKDLDRTLYQIRMRGRTGLSEQGVNILYLAFGFLEWTEAHPSNEPMKSPLLLVPVELKKESILSPYTMTFYEDDVVINPTLCYKLDSDFGLKIEFEPDKNGFTVQKLLDYVSDQVKDLNWKVSTQVQLSLFSFLKLNMYKDLEKNGDRIMSNQIVRALCGEESNIEPVPPEIANAIDLDKIILPVETFQVVDADSSQQQAILAAKKGISFVLQGPPGTGKSQTITNIIAECLADGKKVLFVSEKMAALEVVQRNLQRVGLEDFSLELHSHKSNKVKVVKELLDTLGKQKTQTDDDVLDDLEELAKKKEALNNYAAALHVIREPLKKSVFQIYGEIAQLSEYPDILYKFTDVDRKTMKQLNALVDVLSHYTQAVKKVGENYKDNCFYGFSTQSITFEMKKDIGQHCFSFHEVLSNFNKVVQDCKAVFSLIEYNTIESIKALVSLLELVCDRPKCKPNWLLKENSGQMISCIDSVSKQYKIIEEKEREIFCIYEHDVLKINAGDMLRRFKGEFSSVTRFLNREFAKEKATLKGYARKKKYKLKYDDTVKHLETIKQIQELTESVYFEETALKSWFEDAYQGRASDWTYLRSTLEWITRIQGTYGQSNVTLLFAEQVCGDHANVEALNYKDQLEGYLRTIDSELEFFHLHYNENTFDINNASILELKEKFAHSAERIDYLPDWVDFINASLACVESKITDLIVVLEEDNISIDKWAETMLKRFYLLWIDCVYQNEKSLNEFIREKFEILILDFQNKDVSQFAIAQARIRQKLSMERPDITAFTSRGTEIHTLLREGEKRRKLLPVRKLLEKIPNLLLTIKPCLLMSPLSVSLYLNPESYQFDTVIFDEASQVRSENAIGAIYRGKQLIVVGDREQLPPTNFFHSNTSDSDYDTEDEESDIGAYESILDECGAVLNKLSLLWHYRSRHEHLIAYSNAKIYKNLITFPTPIAQGKDFGVEFVHVPNGVYGSGTSRINKIEANRVAQLVFKHFDEYPNRSLGIVTFSEAQQSAIDSEIIEIRKAKNQYELFFDETVVEPFFIKNLENVQGDERDTIIFSVGYGKSEQGKSTVSFGPLNREGGYRRLNVAITRAKYNVKLVSSILPTDIDLSKTQSRGVHMLRGYMEFALQGVDAIVGELAISEELQFASAFEMQVYDVLTHHGYEVDTQVGCSGYRIDLAVRHPNIEGKYSLAIECDGETYHSARTARERDRLRQDVLKMRGWKVYRIWSPDWIRHRSTEIERLLKKVKNAIDIDESNHVLSIAPEIESIPETTVDDRESSEFRIYKIADVTTVKRDRSKPSIDYAIDVITYIVNVESPVHKELIYRYMAPLYGNEKVTIAITREVDSIISLYNKGRFVVKGDFCWASDMRIPIFRVPLPEGEKRDIKNICIEELAEGMKLIVKKGIGIEKKSLFQEVSRALGFLRNGEKITRALNEAFLLMVKNDIVEIKGETVSIK